MNETTTAPEYTGTTETVTTTEGDITATEGDAAITTEDDSGGSIIPAIQTIVIVEDRPFWTMSFEDYTVTEGLLLCLLLSAFGAALWKLLKGGLSWLH